MSPFLMLPHWCPDPVTGTPPSEVRRVDNLHALAGVQLLVEERIYIEDTGETYRVVGYEDLPEDVKPIVRGPASSFYGERPWYLHLLSRRPGDFIWTASGRKFWPLDPQPEDVPIEDIAHALSHICRWTGHVSVFYSVAQHSVLVSSLVQGPSESLRLYALLHDASEAFLNDIARPLKRLSYMKGYVDVEERVQRVIYRAHGVEHLDDMPAVVDAVRDADHLALAIEARDLMPKAIRGTSAYERIMEPLKHKAPAASLWSRQHLVPLTPEGAKAEFLRTFTALGGVR